MRFTEMREQLFPDYDLDDWKKKAEESLKGKTIESLQRTTYENIVLKPLYTSEDKKAVSEFPGGEDFRRGIDPLGYHTNTWKIAQRISFMNLDELKDKLKLALENGQTALSFEVTAELIDRKDFLGEFIQEYYRKFPLALDAKEFQAEVLSALENSSLVLENPADVTGYVAADPLTSVVSKGSIPDNFSVLLEEFSNTVKKANEKLPNIRTVLVNTTPYHNGGANAVQELGISAATGVFYLDSLSGLEVEQGLNKLIFNFSIGSNYFMEIAKLRAARIMWNKIAEAYGAKEPSRGMQIAAETSLFTKTVYDPYVNLLRAGNETFAALVGGVQYLHVNSFDQITGSSPFSERIARNMQLILQEEAQLKKVIDPAGGSWYIEQLTNELAQKSWAFFQEIEENGGILAVLKSNWLQNKISDVYETRKHDIFTRKQSIIGTNVYANLDETVSKNIIIQTSTCPADSQKEELSIQTIPQIRLAQPFEELRKRSEELNQKSGLLPLVGLICLGNLKQHKARLDFVRGFLSAGGVTVNASEPVHSAEEALLFVTNSNTKHFCICGTNEQYDVLGIEVLQSIKAKLVNRTIYLAGLPDKEDQVKWIENGVKQFIHVKSNCFETLSSILSEMEESLNEQIQA